MLRRLCGVVCITSAVAAPRDQAGLGECTRLDGQTATAEEVRRIYADGERPVVLEGVSDLWATDSLWDREALLHQFGGLRIHSYQVDSASRYNSRYRRLTVENVLTADTDNSYQLINRGHPMVDALLADVSVPAALGDLRQELRISIGSNRSGAIQEQRDSFWSASVRGHAKWFLAPPGRSLPRGHPCKYSSVALERQPGTRTCVVGPRDVLYVPNAYTHATCHIDSFAVSIQGSGSIPSGHLTAALMADVDYLTGIESNELVQVNADGRQTALHVAAKIGHVPVVEFLLARGLDPMVTDADDLHPVHLAAGAGHLNVVKLLVKQRADANVEGGPAAWHPLQFAASGGHNRVVKYLMKDLPTKDFVLTLGAQRAKGEAIFQAAEAGHAALVRSLADVGFDLFARRDDDERGALPIHVAAEYCRAEVVESLVERGINPSLPAGNGKKPKEFAQLGSKRSLAAKYQCRRLVSGWSAIEELSGEFLRFAEAAAERDKRQARPQKRASKKRLQIPDHEEL